MQQGLRAKSGVPGLSPKLTYMCAGTYKARSLCSVEWRYLWKGSVRGDRPLWPRDMPVRACDWAVPSKKAKWRG